MTFIFKKKHNTPLIAVDISIIAMMKDQYVNEVFTVSVPQGTSIRKLLKIARAQNLMNRDIFKFVKKLAPPISLIINGTNVAKNKSSKYSVAQGDQITIFTPLSGG